MKQFKIDGCDYLEKEVTKQSGTAGKIYLPASWIGKKVAVILLPIQEDKAKIDKWEPPYAHGLINI